MRLVPIRRPSRKRGPSKGTNNSPFKLAESLLRNALSAGLQWPDNAVMRRARAAMKDGRKLTDTDRIGSLLYTTTMTIRPASKLHCDPCFLAFHHTPGMRAPLQRAGRHNWSSGRLAIAAACCGPANHCGMRLELQHRPSRPGPMVVPGAWRIGIKIW